MSIDPASRRSIRQISCADFGACPVWEWAINEDEALGHGEALVRPTPHASIPGGVDGQYLVSATAVLSNGSSLPACVEVSIRANKLRVEPMFIFLQDRHLDFSGSESTTVLSHYTKRANTQPLRWELAVPLAGKTAPPAGAVRRSLIARISQCWKRVRVVARGKSILVP